MNHPIFFTFEKSTTLFFYIFEYCDHPNKNRQNEELKIEQNKTFFRFLNRIKCAKIAAGA